MRRRRHHLALALVAGLLAGGWMGSRTAVARADATADQLRTFAQILDLVERRHVDEVPSEELVTGAIRGLLHTLDPHSNFLDRRAYREMREEQRGSFSGLGIVISLRGDENLLTVVSPIEGTPAYRAGIRAGDIIAEIEGVETVGMSIDDALQKLRGPKGTEVSIRVRREGDAELLPFTITRDDIPTNSIQYGYLLQEDVGYIRIKNFTQTTEKELKEKISELRSQGMEKLVLDLRWNPGGLLDQAVKVASHFLEAGDRIVFTRGRTDRANEEYRVPEGGDRVDVPVVVLINRGSASASEIVAGAIQDHDRGLVVGETSWGKGLVQTVYTLSHDSAVALTTARYYTPSGRLIQRDYSSLEDYFSPGAAEDSLAEDELGLTGPAPDEDPEIENREAFFTDAGRKVYGGGGIVPDLRVGADQLSRFTELLERRAAFFEFAIQHRALNPEPPEMATFQVGEAVMSGFRAFLQEKGIEVQEQEFEQDQEYIRRGIRAEIAASFYGLVPRSRILAEGDRQLQEAIRMFPQAERLVERRAAAVRERRPDPAVN